MPSAPKTIYSFEWARALGALAIVVLHVIRACELSDPLAAAAPGLIAAEGLVVFPFARWAVPVFFMMSGALMLDPARSMPLAKVGRHLWRIAFVLLTFGLAFCLLESVYNAGMTINMGVVGEAVGNLLSGRSWDHLWYLYATLGLYAATPVLRWIARRLSRMQLVLVLLLAWALCCGAPTASLVLERVGVRLAVVDALAQCFGWAFSVVYYLAGYVMYSWVSSDADGDTRFLQKILVVLGAAALVAMAFLTLAGYDECQLPEYALALPFGAAVFLLVVRFLEVPTARHPAIGLLSAYSFGIYVIHPLFAHLALSFGPLVRIASAGGALVIACMQIAMVVLGVFGSIAVVRIARLFPGFKGKI